MYVLTYISLKDAHDKIMRRIHKGEKVKKKYNKEEWERKMRLPETNYKIWYGEDEEELGLKLKESKRIGSKEGRNLKRRKKI